MNKFIVRIDLDHGYWFEDIDESSSIDILKSYYSRAMKSGDIIPFGSRLLNMKYCRLVSIVPQID